MIRTFGSGFCSGFRRWERGLNYGSQEWPSGAPQTAQGTIGGDGMELTTLEVVMAIAIMSTTWAIRGEAMHLARPMGGVVLITFGVRAFESSCWPVQKILRYTRFAQE